MASRVAEFLPEIPQERNGPDAIVVVSPWLETPVPWITLALGLMMARRGAQVRFVIDDLPYGDRPLREKYLLGIVRQVMQRVAGRFEVVTLSDYAPEPLTDADRAEIDRLAQHNATWTLRGEMPRNGRARLIARETEQNSRAHGHIKGFFKATKAPDVLLTPGGFFSHSGLWMHEARAHDVRIGNFDAAGFRGMLIAANGLACQLRDIPRAFRRLHPQWETDSTSREFALARAEEELAKRRAGKDRFSYQIGDSGTGESALEGGILVALNSSWDAAALGLHRAFDTNTAWIVGTVRYLLENTDRPVIVRQHPVERQPLAATSDDYAALLRREFGAPERLHFIAAEDPVNSYALLEKVAAVVVHTSTIGMEAVAFGRPVITGSSSYYAELGFVEYADNRADYERLLKAAAQRELSVSAAQRQDAKLCFYLTQCCNWVFSPFNPANYYEWVEQPLSHWAAEPAIARVIHSLNSGTPVAALNHQAMVDGLSDAGSA
ncbi:capsular polysaccharide export protein, LipB/KpsS family [Alteriqipengyuania sp. 357]